MLRWSQALHYSHLDVSSHVNYESDFADECSNVPRRISQHVRRRRSLGSSYTFRSLWVSAYSTQVVVPSHTCVADNETISVNIRMKFTLHLSRWPANCLTTS